MLENLILNSVEEKFTYRLGTLSGALRNKEVIDAYIKDYQPWLLDKPKDRGVTAVTAGDRMQELVALYKMYNKKKEA